MRISIGWSVLMIVAGILAIALPPLAGIAVTLLVGWLLVLSGIAHLMFGWGNRHAGGLAWELLLAVVYLAAGIYVLARPAAGLASLTLLLAIYLLAEGVLELVIYARLRRIGGAGWLLLDAIVTLVLGIMVWSTWPSSAPVVIGTLIGISMLFGGISRLALSMAARRAVAARA
ncbi:MAG TPA: DUF308 domain-containing protein [Thermoanaerobaculia bacterium]|nr:DUF308 domain-containing protein [Thermoanaerobaculia bacterium]